MQNKTWRGSQASLDRKLGLIFFVNIDFHDQEIIISFDGEITLTENGSVVVVYALQGPCCVIG